MLYSFEDVLCKNSLDIHQKNQNLIVLHLVPLKVQLVGVAYRLNLNHGTQSKVTSVASRWQLVLI